MFLSGEMDRLFDVIAAGWSAEWTDFKPVVIDVIDRESASRCSAERFVVFSARAETGRRCNERLATSTGLRRLRRRQRREAVKHGVRRQRCAR